MRSKPKPGWANFDSLSEPYGADSDSSGSVDAALSGSNMSGILWIFIRYYWSDFLFSPITMLKLTIRTPANNLTSKDFRRTLWTIISVLSEEEATMVQGKTHSLSRNTEVLSRSLF